MNRDHVLSAMAGLLVGFIGAYFLFEFVAERQPQRLLPGAAAATAGATAEAEGGPPPAAPFLARVAELERFVEANPQDADAVRELGNLYFDAENWNGAAAAYQHYLSLRPGDADVLSDYGVSLQRLGRAEEALAMFQRAQQLDPAHWQSRYNQALVLAFDLKRFGEAEQVLDDLRKLQPDNPDVERLAAAIAERKNAA